MAYYVSSDTSTGEKLDTLPYNQNLRSFFSKALNVLSIVQKKLQCDSSLSNKGAGSSSLPAGNALYGQCIAYNRRPRFSNILGF